MTERGEPLTYHGRHRVAPPRRRRLRSSGVVTAVVATALLAPIVTAAPTSSQALTTPAVDTLLNHPEWRVPLTDTAASQQVAALKRTLTARAIPYDPARLAAYRVPTVAGWTTYVTARPETMQVRPNTGLIERTPEGVRSVPVTEVALNFGAAPDVVATVAQVQQIVAPLVATDVDLAALLARLRSLPAMFLDTTGVDALIAQLTPIVESYRAAAYDQAMQAVASVKAAADRPLPEPNDVIASIKRLIAQLDVDQTGADRTIDAAKATVEALDVMGRIEALLQTVGMYDPEQFVATARALIDSLPVPTVDPHAVLSAVNKIVQGVDVSGYVPDVAATIESVKQTVAPYTQIDVDLAALIEKVKSIPGTIDLSGVDHLVAQVTGLVETYRAAGYGAALDAVTQIKAATDRPLPEPNDVIDGIRDAIGPLDLTVVDETVAAAKAVIDGLNLLGRLEALLQQAGRYDPQEFVTEAVALIHSVPIPTVDPSIIPTVNPTKIVTMVTKLVNGLSLNDLMLTKMDVNAGALVEVVPVAVASPPPVADNLMVNPNMPKPLGKDEPDGGGAYWSTPQGGKDCFDVITDAYKRLVCWQIDRQFEDNDPNYNFWQFHVDISGQSVDRYMDRMWTEVVPQPQGQHIQKWDAQPAPNTTYGGSEGCQANGNQFSISSGAPVQIGFSYYWERTTCETYTPKDYSEPGHWASIWEGNPKVREGERRAVMLKAPVKTPSDKGVQWELWTGQRTS